MVAFGGDGTVNEAVNGLIGSRTPLSCLPGGSTNVYCRLLGIPREIVDATEHLLRMADDWHPRRVDVGQVNGRRFAFSAGLGLDASVVRRVDAHPRLKARLGAYYFSYVAVGTFSRRYLVRPPRLVASVPVEGGEVEEVSGVTAIVQNAAPFTYFLGRRIDIAEGATRRPGTHGRARSRALVLRSPAMATVPLDEGNPGRRRVGPFWIEEGVGLVITGFLLLGLVFALYIVAVINRPR